MNVPSSAKENNFFLFFDIKKKVLRVHFAVTYCISSYDSFAIILLSRTNETCLFPFYSLSLLLLLLLNLNRYIPPARYSCINVSFDIATVWVT